MDVRACQAGATLRCIPANEIGCEEHAWNELTDAAAEPNPFYESWFLLPSLENMPDAHEVSILCLELDGKLSALMPVVRQSQYSGWPLAHISNWLHPNIFLGTPLIAAGAEEIFWRALLDWADANTGFSLFLHLNEIALSGPVFESLESVLVEDGREWGVVEHKERAVLGFDLGAEDYRMGAFSARKRKDLNRRFRRLSEFGKIEFRWETGNTEVGRWIDDFLSLEASGWKGEAGSALRCNETTKALFEDCLTGAANRERLIRLSLRIDDNPIAMLSTFLSPPGAFGFKTAFDEEFSRFAPGLLLEREFFDALDRFDIEWCDSCAAADHSVMNRIWQERRPIGRVSIAIGGALRRAAFGRILRKEISGLDTGDDT